MATIITVKRPFVLSLPIQTTQKRLLDKDGKPVTDANGKPVFVEEVTAVTAKEIWFRQTGQHDVALVAVAHKVAHDDIAKHPYITSGANGCVALPGEIPVQVVAPPPPATPEEARQRAEEMMALINEMEMRQALAATPPTNPAAAAASASAKLTAALNTPVNQLPKVDPSTAFAAADAPVASATVQAPQVPLPSGQLPPGKSSAGASAKARR